MVYLAFLAVISARRQILADLGGEKGVLRGSRKREVFSGVGFRDVGHWRLRFGFHRINIKLKIALI